MRGILFAGLVAGCAGLFPVRAEEPPRGKELTPEERKELEQKWREAQVSAERAFLSRDLATAERGLRECLDLARRLNPGKDSAAVADALGNLGAVLLARGKSDQAEPLLREARDTLRRLHKGDHPDVATSQYNFGFVLRTRGKLREAEPLLREAMEMRARLFKGDHPDTAQSQYELAILLHTLSRYADAEPLYRDALSMRKRLFKGDHPVVAVSLNSLAAALRDQGKYAEAEPLYRDALSMRKRLFKGDHPAVAQSLNNLAGVLHNRGMYADAEVLYRESLDMHRRLFKGDHPLVAASLNNLAGALRDRGNYADAEPLYRDALDMRKRLFKGDHPDVARSLNNMGAILLDRGRSADAELLYRESLDMHRRLFKGDHPGVAHALNNLAAVLHARGNYADAEPLFDEALSMRKRLFTGDHPDVAESLSHLAAVLRDRGRYGDAEPLLKDALRMSDRLAAVHAQIGAEGSALTLAASAPRFGSAFLLNARDNRTDPRSVYAEVWASKATVGRVAERRALSARAATDPKATDLLSALRALRQRRTELLLAPTPTDPGTRDGRDTELQSLARTVQELDRALHPLLPRVGRLEKLAAATPDDLRKALPADAVFVDLLAYTHFERAEKVPGQAVRKRTPSYTAFVVTRDAVHWVDLGPADKIDSAVRLWREALTTAADREPLPDLPLAVRERVWAPIRKFLPEGVKVVYIAPDAALTGVPWGAIPGDRRGTVLLEELAVAVVPHGPALLDALWPADPTRRRTAGMLAVGGVAYGDEPEHRSGWGAAVVALGRSQTRGELPTDPKKQLVWSDLAGARVEAEQIRNRAVGRGLDARLLSGAAASTDRVLAELGTIKYAHLATHGFFADPSFRSVFRLDPALFAFDRGGRERIGAGAVNPMVMSGLVFAGANRPGTPGRGVLTGEALLDRDLSGLELAVLSACETGLGNVADGQGVFGLQRAFHLAGCRNVVASLWKVNDEATAALMGEFYRNLWDQKLPPVEALRRAQLTLMRADPKEFRALAQRGVGKGDVKDPKLAADIGRPMADGKRNPPALWAAFVLSGPGRAPE
jgi:CHAT domain-containing protein/tetratricopeptide (TPR) repeat protein